MLNFLVYVVYQVYTLYMYIFTWHRWTTVAICCVVRTRLWMVLVNDNKYNCRQLIKDLGTKCCLLPQSSLVRHTPSHINVFPIRVLFQYIHVAGGWSPSIGLHELPENYMTCRFLPVVLHSDRLALIACACIFGQWLSITKELFVIRCVQLTFRALLIMRV